MRSTMKRIVVLGAAVLLAAACGSNVETNGATSSGTSSSETGTGGQGGGEPPSDVNGTVSYRYYGEASVVDQPVALNGVQVLAYVMEGGAWKPYPGAGHGDGSFTVPAVPAGPFLLDVGGLYLHTTSRKVDLGADLGGRPDAAAQANGGAQISGNVQNLSPWSSNDTIEWYCANAGGVGYGFVQGTDPVAGATSLTGQSSDWIGDLVDGSKGDVLYATQLHMAVTGTTYFATAVRFASFPGVQQQDGQVTSVSGTFTSVTADQQGAVDFRASEFAKRAKEVSPSAMSYGAAYDLSTAPGAGAVGLLGYSADLLDVYPGESDAVVETPFGNPFPAAWGSTVYAGETFSVDVTAPGATTPATQYGSIYVILPPDKAAGGPIAPLVTPALSPTLDGKDAFGAVGGVSLTPTLAWKPPALGKPNAYRVVIYRLSNLGGASQLDYQAMISTSDTSLTLPPDLLEKGQSYVFVITAVVSSLDLASAPYRSSPTMATADALTGVAGTQ